MSYKEGLMRLEKIKSYLKENGGADVDTLAILFFPTKHRAQVVLSNFAQQKELARKRYDQYVYFLPKFAGDIKETRLKNRTATIFKKGETPNGYTIKEENGVFHIKNQWKNEAVILRPLFTPEDKYRIKPGEKVVTVGFDYIGLPRADNLIEAIKKAR